ncbi:MAG: Qat anti-phage system TatD family nuclease QatD [Patescibacteria group bacterium]
MIKFNDFRYIDTHCHLDLYKDYKSVIEDSKANETLVLAVTSTPSVFKQDSALFDDNNNIITSLGLHPQIAEQYAQQINLFEELLPNTQFIGEVGIDDPKNTKQIEIFKRILKAAATYGDKIISVHSRNSANEVVPIIGSAYPGHIIMHWYSGSFKLLRESINNGYLFSINPAMVISKTGQQIISSLPLDCILTETDGPFTKIGERNTVPANVQIVIEYLAKVHNKTTEEIRNIIKTNFFSTYQK